jgi:large subunit ribosomal protein L1
MIVGPVACDTTRKTVVVAASRMRGLTVAKRDCTLTEAIHRLRQSSGRRQDATISARIKLNLDPRRTGQKLKGVFEYPHSTGKGTLVAVYTRDAELADDAVRAGARFAGDIKDRIIYNEIQWPRDFERLVTTFELENVVVHRKLLLERMKRNRSGNIFVPDISSDLAKLLRAAQIVPSVEDRTLVEPDQVVDVVRGYVNGTIVRFATDHDGNITTRIGKLTMSDSELHDNFDTLLNHLRSTQPNEFAVARARKRKVDRYVLDIQIIASSRADPVRLDLSCMEMEGKE